MRERLHVSTRPRQTWRVAVVAAAVGLPLVVIAPVLTVLLVSICAMSGAVMSAMNLPKAAVFLAASLGLLIPVSLYFGLALVR
jgi:hypothetical protein